MIAIINILPPSRSSAAACAMSESDLTKHWYIPLSSRCTVTILNLSPDGLNDVLKVGLISIPSFLHVTEIPDEDDDAEEDDEEDMEFAEEDIDDDDDDDNWERSKARFVQHVNSALFPMSTVSTPGTTCTSRGFVTSTSILYRSVPEVLFATQTYVPES